MNIDMLLKNAGVKVTLSRVQIVKLFLDENNSHLTAEEVYKHLHTVHGEAVSSLATVYRDLSQLEGAAVLKRLQFNGAKSCFELNSNKHHDHIVCTECGHVMEFHSETIEERQRQIVAKHNMRIRRHTMTLYCACTDEQCSRRPNQEEITKQ